MCVVPIPPTGFHIFLYQYFILLNLQNSIHRKSATYTCNGLKMQGPTPNRNKAVVYYNTRIQGVAEGEIKDKRYIIITNNNKYK